MSSGSPSQRRGFRLPSATDDRGSMPMPMLMLVILVGMSFAALLIPMILTQNQSTRFDTSRASSLHAAESGLDAALGLMRAANSGDNSDGDTTKLPCGPLNGTVNGPDVANSKYTVTIGYYRSDPGGHDDDWLGDNVMKCMKDYGSYAQTTSDDTPVYTPSYALLTSTGTAGTAESGASSGRTVQTTYVVQTTNTNISGGRIRLFSVKAPDGGGKDLCIVPSIVPAAAGHQVVLQPCDPLSPDKTWSYNSDLSIQLVSSVTDTAKVKEPHGNGLCLDSNGAHAKGAIIILQWCVPQVTDEEEAGTGVPRNINAPWNQKWSSDDNAHLCGSKPDKSDTSGLCINGDSAKPHKITLENEKASVTDPNQTWVPDRNVGAGAAGAPDPLPNGYMATMHQLVNYYQFGRCLDVTGKDPNSKFLIVYSCKQNPDVSKVTWNQKWAYRADSQSWVTNDGKNDYCLVSPKSDGGYVTVKLCRTISDKSAKWRNNLTEDSSGGQLAYRDKYTMVDSSNRCMSVGPITDLLDGAYYKIIVAPCDGTAKQKWNASSNLLDSSLQNTIEPLKHK